MTTDVRFSDFGYGTTSSFPEIAALQAGANVRLNPAALAYAIALALGTIARDVNMAGAITAANLGGTNTGDQIAATVPYTPGSVPGVSNVQDALDYLATHSGGGSTTPSYSPWGQPGIQGEAGDPAPASAWPAGPAAPNSFILPLFSGSASTKYDSTMKRVVGQIYFNPGLAKWKLSATSTATLFMVLQTTDGAIYAAGDLYRETGSGAPTTVAAVSTTTSTTAALVSVDVTAAFVVSADSGIFDARIWVQTYNGTVQATCTEAWIEVTP